MPHLSTLAWIIIGLVVFSVIVVIKALKNAVDERDMKIIEEKSNVQKERK